jgi:stage II sporulation protein AA (anti-sigma F factor antagonist)
MNVVVEPLREAASLVRLEGRLDHSGAMAVEGPLRQARESASLVVVDLAGVSFMASVGIRVLLAAAKALSNSGGSLRLVRPSAMVADILTTAGIDTLIPIDPDLETALDA